MMVRFSTFTEGEVRIFVPALFTDAVESVRNGTADGMTVDVIDSDGNYCLSYEMQVVRGPGYLARCPQRREVDNDSRRPRDVRGCTSLENPGEGDTSRDVSMAP